MTVEEFVRHLREAGPEHVDLALGHSELSLPLTAPHEALEFFNSMIDLLTGERLAQDAADADRITPGFGSTH